MVGKVISHYKVLAKLGEGGIGAGASQLQLVDFFHHTSLIISADRSSPATLRLYSSKRADPSPPSGHAFVDVKKLLFLK